MMEWCRGKPADDTLERRFLQGADRRPGECRKKSPKHPFATDSLDLSNQPWKRIKARFSPDQKRFLQTGMENRAGSGSGWFVKLIKKRIFDLLV